MLSIIGSAAAGAGVGALTASLGPITGSLVGGIGANGLAQIFSELGTELDDCFEFSRSELLLSGVGSLAFSRAAAFLGRPLTNAANRELAATAGNQLRNAVSRAARNESIRKTTIQAAEGFPRPAPICASPSSVLPVLSSSHSLLLSLLIA